MCQKQLNSYTAQTEMDQFVTISMPWKAQKTLLAYIVETRGCFHTICCDRQRDCHHLWTMALVDQKRSFELMNWKRSSMQQLIKTTTLLSGFSRLMRFPAFATIVWRKPTKVHASYTAEKRFEIHKYHLCHPEASFWRRHCRYFLKCLRLRHSTSSSDSRLES